MVRATTIIITAAAYLCFAPELSLAQSDECAALLSQGIVNTIRITKKGSQQQYSHNELCDDVRQAKNQSNDTNIEASYKIISAKYGISRNFAESFSKNYCESATLSNIGTDFVNMVGTQIEPSLAVEYNRCKEITSTGLRYTVTRGMDESQLTLSVWYAGGPISSTAYIEKLETTGQTENCTGNLPDAIRAAGIRYRMEGTKAVTCRRKIDFMETPDGTVQIKRPLNIRLYTNAGFIQAELAETKEVISPAPNAIERRLVPRGAVVAFNLESCPKGWANIDYLDGKFIRGTMNSALKVGSSGGSAAIKLSESQIPAIEAIANLSSIQSKRGNDIGHWQGDVQLLELSQGTDPNRSTVARQLKSKNKEGAEQIEILPPWYSLKFCEKD